MPTVMPRNVRAGFKAALCFPLLAWSCACAAADASAAAAEIATATTPLPALMKDAAAVVRLDAAGKPESLRAGSNGMVCIADLPGDADFDVRCYNKDFIAVVYRSFQLRRQVGTHGGVSATIEAEIKAGKIKLPDQPTAGYRCLGPASAYDAATNSTKPPMHCWQSIHFPYRTAAELGLLDESQVTEAQKSMLPYVMSSGKYWSHVMIEHPEPAAKP
jgi:hypothetical protein